MIFARHVFTESKTEHNNSQEYKKDQRKSMVSKPETRVLKMIEVEVSYSNPNISLRLMSN